jgi:diaminohydroxyphosphoribosylaminopyrimidine deaminase/5-amino-6-(5-phosphoribosylamino)uracil reductase
VTPREAARAIIDRAYMERALELAEAHRGRTAPNPIVGCVIVDRDGALLAEGAHVAAGRAHAEAAALATCGGRADGGTMYVTLEPCTHHGRTPPCAPAVIASGVARVVVGSEDPAAGHGGGLAALRRAGVRVDRALVDACDAANRPFFTWATKKRPAFTLKAAITLDGKIATVHGHSKWITGEAARRDAHRLRDTHDAILVGIGTVLRDDPQLTARIPRARDPVRVVVDSKLRTPADARLLPRRRGPRTIVATRDDAPVAKERALVRAGAEVWRFAGRGDRVPMERLARALGDAGLTSVLVEGGGEIHASLLAARLADELVLYVASRVVGGPAPSWVGGDGVATLGAAHGFGFTSCERVGEDLRVTAIRDR